MIVNYDSRQVLRGRYTKYINVDVLNIIICMVLLLFFIFLICIKNHYPAHYYVIFNITHALLFFAIFIFCFLLFPYLHNSFITPCISLLEGNCTNSTSPTVLVNPCRRIKRVLLYKQHRNCLCTNSCPSKAYKLSYTFASPCS